MYNISSFSTAKLYVISGFLCEVDENCAFLGYYEVSSNNFLPTFSGFGGLVVSMLASGTRVRGLENCRSRWIFQVSE